MADAVPGGARHWRSLGAAGPRRRLRGSWSHHRPLVGAGARMAPEGHGDGSVRGERSEPFHFSFRRGLVSVGVQVTPHQVRGPVSLPESAA